MGRKITTIRARKSWIEAMQTTADRFGISRSSAIQLTATIGAKILDGVTLTQKQINHVLASAK